MEKDRTNVLLDKDMMITLKNLAQIENRSITSIVREAISEYIAKRNIKKDFTIIGIGESKPDNRDKIKSKDKDISKDNAKDKNNLNYPNDNLKLNYKENLRKKAGG